LPASSYSDRASIDRSTADVRFERVQPRHARALAALFERNDEPAMTQGFDPFALVASEARRIAADRGRDRYYVAFHREKIVAMSMLRGFDEGFEIPSFGIFVDRQWQGRGVGRGLTEWTLAAARQMGCRTVRLSVYADNRAALALYESLGFIAVERSTIDRARGRRERIVMHLSVVD
jgi:ribosomal-protein-alanine N-acetyltransferase